jgi:hypothetical protein
LECDIIHPLIPLNYCISLININKPIITNVPILLKEDSYQLIKSIYIRNTYDIKNITTVIDILINEIYEKISDKNSVLLINQFSSWDNNFDILNNYIYKKYFESNCKSCLIYIKNKYKIIESLSSENKDKSSNSIFEDIILKKKDDSSLFGNLFNKTKDNNNQNCKKIEVEMNFRYGDDDSNCILDINNKKKNEEKISILSHFDINKCKKYSISLNNIIFLYDNPFITEFQSECKNEDDYKSLKDIMVDSLINKFCVILKNNSKYDNQFYFLDDIPFDSREIFTFIKVLSFNKDKNEINLYCDMDIDDEIKKNKKILILSEQRIEKNLKRNRKDNFNEILSKIDFSYDITNEEETKMLTNGLNYLGNNEDEFV